MAVRTLLLVFLGSLSTVFAARIERIEWLRVALDLPGPPSKIFSADVNGDGRSDLLVVVAFTEIDEIGEDRVENMVQFTSVIPAAFDRRELRVYLADGSGGYAAGAPPLALAPDVLHLEAVGPSPGPRSTLIASTDTGLSELRLGDGGTLEFVPVLKERPALAGSGSFFPLLTLVHDLDGNGTGDLLFPATDGIVVHLRDRTGSFRETQRIPFPRDVEREADTISRRYPLPEVFDVNGDARPDLVFFGGLVREREGGIDVLLGDGDGRFRPLRQAAQDCHDDLTDLRWAGPTDPNEGPWPPAGLTFRDLDGDGRAEWVLDEQSSRGDSLRKGLKDAKRPIRSYRFHRLEADLAVARRPYTTYQAEGHIFNDGESGSSLPSTLEEFEDLDGDGRADLITLTLDFSVFQLLRILTTKKIGVELDFRVHVQSADGGFAPVSGLDLSEKLKLDLGAMALGRFAQFAGDFDGDGRQDFVHLGRGKRLTLHRGQPGARYPREPDLVLELEAEPASLDLVRIADFDGDGRSDLSVTHPLPATDVDATAPVRLELYLSSGVGR